MAAGATEDLGACGGTVLAEPLRTAAVALGEVEMRCPSLYRATEEELTTGLEQLGDLRAGLERMTVMVALEAATRECHLTSGLSLHDWLSSRCPWLPRTEISDLVTVVTDLSRPAHAPIKTAITGGTVPIRRAARLLRCLRLIYPVTDLDTYERCVTLLLPVAADHRYTDADLKRATDHLLALALPETDQETRAGTLHQLRGVHESSLADGSLTRFVVTADPEGAAIIRAVLTSPLAAPAPDDDGPDPRTATQRRYDALIAVITRGVGSPGEAPTTSKARVLVTINFDTLKGQFAGPGFASTGETLSPATVRKLACTAELIPLLLGGDSEVLDLGRASRLATPAQHLVLWRRDRHCTYPGCTVPPQWCDAHHLQWWSRGGPTDLDNLTLLCGRHHTLIHQRDLTATRNDTGITWHRR